MAQNIFCEQLLGTAISNRTVNWNVWPPSYLFTIGYEGKSISTFVNRLMDNGISTLVDVRCNAISRKKGFSKTALRNNLLEKNINYYHIPQLGVPTKYRRGLSTPESYDNLFCFYDTEILPLNLKYVEKIKELLQLDHRVAIMCFEADFKTCHRHRISNYMSQDHTIGIEISHL